MIYSILKGTLLRLLKAPAEAPEAPAGSHSSVRVFRASPRFLTYRLVGVATLAAIFFAVWVFVGIAIMVNGEPAALLIMPPMALLFLFIVGCVYVNVRIDYDMRYYIVTDRSLRIRQGAFIIKEMTLTHANVQNLNIVQGPLQRAFGIKSLAVDTAGGGGAQAGAHGSGHSFQMAGIENAVEVRDLVLGYLKQAGMGTGLGDPDDDSGRSSLQGLSTAGLAALREVRDEATALRRTAEAAAAGG